MIYARLHGRLGNQMFQYAAAYGLAARLSVPFSIDTRRAVYKGEGELRRVFDLDWAEPEKLPPSQNERPLAYYLWRAFKTSPKIYRERTLAYDPNFETLGDGTYLHGYWLSEKYFSNVEDELRKAFVYRYPMSSQNAEMAQQIAETTSICLHVRRGDFVDLGVNTFCDQSYYEKGLAAVSEGLKDPTVFVFSDDPQWAKDHLPLPFKKVVVDFNGPETDYEDQRLMSLCEHNVIANSSFSWWAAWLNKNPEKRVAGPKKWFVDPKRIDIDILADGWIRI